jgi:hypothetical protein
MLRARCGPLAKEKITQHTLMDESRIIKKLEEHPNRSIWSYDSEQSKPGAFRTVSVEALVRTPSCVEVAECPSLSDCFMFAAISHIWKPSEMVEKNARKFGGPL